jgi:hypothetical protein
MTMFRALSVVVLGLSTAALGCADGGGEVEELGAVAADAPVATPQGGAHGSSSTNNLSPVDFHAQKATLLAAMQAPLATYSSSAQTWWLANNAPDNALLASTGGRSVLKYAARCALATTSAVNAQVGSSVVTYPGQGLLTTASAWKTTALDADQTDDLFTCLLAHLNSNGVEVPINLSGPSVSNAGSYDPAFSWEEALWATKLVEADDGTTAFNFYVWPRGVAGCPNAAIELANRVCGTAPGSCGLTVRTDIDSACTETGAGWYCDDPTGHALPAILTRLKLNDVKRLYSSCI